MDSSSGPLGAPDRSSSAARAWRGLGRSVVDHPWPITIAVTLLALAASLAAARWLEIRPGYVDLLSPDSPVQARYLALLEEMGNVEALHVVVEARDETAARQFVDEFGAAVVDLEVDGRPVVADVLAGVDMGWFVDRLPAYLPEAVLAGLAAPPPPGEPDRLAALVANPSPEALLAAVTAAVRHGIERGEEPEGGPARIAALAELLDRLAAAAAGREGSVGEWLQGLAAQRSGGLLDATGHLRLSPGRLLVTVTPSDTRNEYEPLAAFLGAVKDVARSVEDRMPPGAGLRVTYTGAPQLVVDEMRAARRDIARSTVVSLVLVTALYLVSFRPVRHVLAAVAAGIAGLMLTFGAAIALVGALNLFSAVFAAVLVGIGMDFGIHVVSFYERARRAHVPPREALIEAFAVTGPPTGVGAITTTTAFLAIVLSEFRGFSQLGLVSGVGVLLCLVTAYTLLPALLALDARRGWRLAPPPRHPWTAPLLEYPVRQATPVLVAGGALLVVAALGLTRLKFDYNLLNLQPLGTEAVSLAEGRGREAVATHFAYSITGTVEEAARREEAFARLGSVASARSAASLVPAWSSEKAAGLRALAARAGSARPAAVLPEIDLEALHREADGLEEALVEAQDLAFDADRTEEVAALDGALASLRSLRDGAESAGARHGLTRFRDESARQLGRMVALLPRLADEGIPTSELPRALAARLVGRTGKLPVVVEPAGSVWDRAQLERFVSDLRTVDAAVTGPPIQVLEVTTAMKRSLERSALMALAVITVIVVVTFRGLLGAVLALGPVLAGFVLMLGGMGWLSVPLNPANLVILPLLLGIGVDGGVHVAHRWLRRRNASRALAEIGHALVVTSLTTVAGFGALLLAAHRGIRSLGVLACLGTLAMLFASSVLLPAALATWERRRSRVEGPPSEAPDVPGAPP